MKKKIIKEIKKYYKGKEEIIQKRIKNLEEGKTGLLNLDERIKEEK